jgi:hypothetical protein
MVNANPAKELQNVLPKCNPLYLHIEYYVYRAGGTAGKPAFVPRTLTTCYPHNRPKMVRLHLPLVAFVVHIVTK